MALEGHCPRYRPAAASEGQENRGAERSGKAKPTPKTAIPGALCHVLCEPSLAG